MNLKEKTISGVIWNSFERVSVQTIRFIMNIILARIITPGDYGLIGMLTVFISLSNVFIDSGFAHTLIQKKDADNTDFSTIFYFNIALAFVFYLILFFSAPAIAAFYNKPELIALSRVIFINLIFNSLIIIQSTLISKNLNFKVYSRVTILSYFVSGIVGITMAYKGYGVWSLVIQSVCNAFLQTCLIWYFNSWRPKLIFSMKSFRNLFLKSSNLLATGIIVQVFENVYTVVIGKLYSNVNLGLYTQAKRLQDMPVMTINAVIQTVTFPALANIQDDNARLKSSYAKILQLFMFVNLPLMIGLIVVSRPLIVFLLTDKWLPIVPFFVLFCLAGAFTPIGLINGNMLKVKGQFNLIFKLELVKRTIMILLLLITSAYGLNAIVFGQMIFMLTGMALNLYFGGKTIGYGVLDQIKSILPYFIISFTAVLPAYFLQNSTLFPNNTVLLMIQISSIIVIYLWMSRIFKLFAYIEIMSILKSKLKLLQNR